MHPRSFCWWALVELHRRGPLTAGVAGWRAALISRCRDPATREPSGYCATDGGSAYGVAARAIVELRRKAPLAVPTIIATDSLPVTGCLEAEFIAILLLPRTDIPVPGHAADLLSTASFPSSGLRAIWQRSFERRLPLIRDLLAANLQLVKSKVRAARRGQRLTGSAESVGSPRSATPASETALDFVLVAGSWQIHDIAAAQRSQLTQPTRRVHKSVRFAGESNSTHSLSACRRLRDCGALR